MLKEELEGSRYDKWGFVVYRTTYADDEAWACFKKAVDERTREDIAESDEPEIAEKLDWTFVEDRDALDGASRDQLRARFKTWAAEAYKTENPRAMNFARPYVHPWFDRSPRYKYFVQVDEGALREVVSPDYKVDWSYGYVNLIDSEWEPDLEDEEGDGVGQYEPIDGYTGQDVGWFRVAPNEVFAGCFYMEISTETWYRIYERPPEVRYC